MVKTLNRTLHRQIGALRRNRRPVLHNQSVVALRSHQLAHTDDSRERGPDAACRSKPLIASFIPGTARLGGETMPTPRVGEGHGSRQAREEHPDRSAK